MFRVGCVVVGPWAWAGQLDLFSGGGEPMIAVDADGRYTLQVWPRKKTDLCCHQIAGKRRRCSRKASSWIRLRDVTISLCWQHSPPRGEQ